MIVVYSQLPRKRMHLNYLPRRWLQKVRIVVEMDGVNCFVHKTEEKIKSEANAFEFYMYNFPKTWNHWSPTLPETCTLLVSSVTYWAAKILLLKTWTSSCIKTTPNSLAIAFWLNDIFILPQFGLEHFWWQVVFWNA